jgi:hypothetical protein
MQKRNGIPRWRGWRGAPGVDSESKQPNKPPNQNQTNHPITTKQTPKPQPNKPPNHNQTNQKTKRLITYQPLFYCKG